MPYYSVYDQSSRFLNLVYPFGIANPLVGSAKALPEFAGCVPLIGVSSSDSTALPPKQHIPFFFFFFLACVTGADSEDAGAASDADTSGFCDLRADFGLERFSAAGAAGGGGARDGGFGTAAGGGDGFARGSVGGGGGACGADRLGTGGGGGGGGGAADDDE